MRLYIIIVFVLFPILLIFAGSTGVQKSIPSKVDSQEVSSQSQIFDSLNKKIERIETLLQKQVLQTVNTPQKENWWKVNAGWVKDWVNSLFFIVAIIGTGLTFWFNRMTLFNPLRTEVFKKQFEIYTDLLNTIVDPKICSHEDIILLNILNFSKNIDLFKKIIQDDDFYKKVLEQKYDSLAIDNVKSVAIFGNHSSNPYYFKSANDKYTMLKIIIDSNTLSVWEKLHSISASPFIADEVKDLIQKLIISIKENIKVHLAPLIEGEINNLYEWFKDSENTKNTKKSNTEISTIENLVITISWIAANNEYKIKKIDNNKYFEKIKYAVSRQLKIHEILKQVK